MFEVKALRDKLLKQWARFDFHRRWLADDLDFPLQMALPKITNRQLMHDFSELQAQVMRFRQAFAGNDKVVVIEKEYQFASMGRQRIPAAVEFLSLEGVLAFTGKKGAWQAFTADVVLIRQHLPQADLWMAENSALIEQYHGDWPRLIAVCQYFIAHPRPNRYLRELDIPGIDSKFIETRKRVIKQLLDHFLPQEALDLRYSQLANFGFEQRFGLRHEAPGLRFRLLDPALAQRFCGVRDMTIPVTEFCCLALPLKAVYITENKVNFLAFPDIPHSMVIFGQGFGVQLLKQVSWLMRAPLYYWGDIDSNGFAILSQLRSYFAHVQSFLMDEKTLEACAPYWGEEPEGNVHSAELLPFLTEPEQQVYQRIKTHYWKPFLRVEQEQIPFHLLQQAIDYLNPTTG